MTAPVFTAAELAACAEREVRQREHVYPRLGMTPARQREIAMMRAIAAEYRARADAEASKADLFGRSRA